MSNIIFKELSNAEGRYLQDSELSTVQNFVNSYTQRISTYRYLQENKDTLIIKTLRSLMPSNRQVIQQHSDICKRDMSHVLRYVALSILKDDENGFIEELILWMQNILFSLHKEEQSVAFYIAMKTVVTEQMIPGEAALVNHYLSLFIDALKVGQR
ncbi:MAG: hypothetical protein AAGA75_00130 [Cyanobacteria bacterium P01_E01_bin.6]